MVGENGDWIMGVRAPNGIAPERGEIDQRFSVKSPWDHHHKLQLSKPVASFAQVQRPDDPRQLRVLLEISAALYGCTQAGWHNHGEDTDRR